MSKLRLMSQIEKLPETIVRLNRYLLGTTVDNRVIEAIYRILNEAIANRPIRSMLEGRELEEFSTSFTTPENFKKTGRLYDSIATEKEASCLQGTLYLLFTKRFVVVR